jgi:hypothetical protein
MKKLYFTEIDDQFNSATDLVLGPWCLPNLPSLKNIHFIEPYTVNEILPMHRKLFDLAFFLLRRDFKEKKESLKRIDYLLLQNDYLFFVFFAFSRYKVLKKILDIASIDEIIFEDVVRPKGRDIFSLCFNSAGTGYLASEILKCLIKYKKIKKFKNTNTNANFRIDGYGDNTNIHVVLFLKAKIKRAFNNLFDISGIYFFQGMLLSFFYKIINLNNKGDSSFFLYNPKIDFDEETSDFMKIFDKLSDLFIEKQQVGYRIEKKINKLVVQYPPFISNHMRNFLKNKIIIPQHGSYYATIKKHFLREMEHNFTFFITWGKKWFSYLDRKNIINFLPSPHLSSLANSYAFKDQKDILWVTGAHLKGGDGLEYLYGTEVLKYIEKKINFHKYIDVKLKEFIVCKALKPTLEQFCDKLQNILGAKYVTDGTAIERMYDAKVLFLDHYGTSFYEAMSMNIPVVLGFFECVPLFTEDAVFIFQKFEEVGVVYKTPETAAHFLNELYYKDIKKWWNDEKIQSVRKEFLEKYANNKPYFWPWLKAILKREI